MQLEGVFADTTTGAALPPQPKELDKDAFLQLLVTQLQHQDPIEPAKNEEFIAQLANFSSLEQMELLNENLVTLTLLQQSNELLSQLTASSGLIGQEVRYVDEATGGEAVGTVDSVKVQDGMATLNVGGKDVPLLSVIEVLGAPGEAGDVV